MGPVTSKPARIGFCTHIVYATYDTGEKVDHFCGRPILADDIKYEETPQGLCCGDCVDGLLFPRPANANAYGAAASKKASQAREKFGLQSTKKGVFE